MKQGSTLFLKIAVILMGIPVLALCIFLLPRLANNAAELIQNIAYILYPILIDYVCISDPVFSCVVSGF